MCNPRKVMIHLSRSIEEAWRQTVTERATAGGEVQELARVEASVALDAEMGDMARKMLERVLAGEIEGFEPWDRDDQGRFTRELEGITMTYDPASSRLFLQAELSSRVSAAGQAAVEICGVTTGEIAAEAVAHYYDDGWGGRTEKAARETAKKQVERQLASAVERLHSHQQAENLSVAESEVQEQARAQALEELEKVKEETRLLLRQQLQGVLSRAEAKVYQVMNRAVGEAYRQTLKKLVLDNGGRVVADRQTGSVISLELELY